MSFHDAIASYSGNLPCSNFDYLIHNILFKLCELSFCLFKTRNSNFPALRNSQLADGPDETSYDLKEESPWLLTVAGNGRRLLFTLHTAVCMRKENGAPLMSQVESLN